jgi:DNA-binding NtrC family response regulator
VRFSPELLEVMGRSNWPGNVRELENYVERLLVVCDEQTLESRVLPGDLEEAATTSVRPSISGLHGYGVQTLGDALATVERDLIAEALRRSGGNRSKAARSLGMAEPTLRYRIRRLGVEAEEETSPPPRKS